MPYRSGPHPLGQSPGATNSVFGYGSSAYSSPKASMAATSNISTASPYTGSQMRQYAAIKPAARVYGQSSGDRSRQAYGQAVATRQANDYTQAMQDTGRQFQQAAEKARSGDIYAQRASQARRYGLDQAYEQDRRSIETQNAEDIANQNFRVAESRRDRQTALRSAIVQSLIGGGVMSALGNANLANKNGQEFFGGMGGGMGGAMGRFAGGAALSSVGVNPMLMALV